MWGRGNLSHTVKLKIHGVLLKRKLVPSITIQVILKSTLNLRDSGINMKYFNWWITDKGEGVDKVVNESSFWVVGTKSEGGKWAKSSE